MQQLLLTLKNQIQLRLNFLSTNKNVKIKRITNKKFFSSWSNKKQVFQKLPKFSFKPKCR